VQAATSALGKLTLILKPTNKNTKMIALPYINKRNELRETLETLSDFGCEFEVHIKTIKASINEGNRDIISPELFASKVQSLANDNNPRLVNLKHAAIEVINYTEAIIGLAGEIGDYATQLEIEIIEIRNEIINGIRDNVSRNLSVYFEADKLPLVVSMAKNVRNVESHLSNYVNYSTSRIRSGFTTAAASMLATGINKVPLIIGIFKSLLNDHAQILRLKDEYLTQNNR
jgi:hypothetical protein